MKIGHDMAEKKFVPGWGRVGFGLGWGWVFSKFKEWSKPFNREIQSKFLPEAWTQTLRIADRAPSQSELQKLLFAHICTIN